MKLEGKTAIITGSNSGIGAETARLMAKEGASVVVHYSKNSGGAEDVANEIRGAGGKATVCKADLCSEAELKAMAESAYREYGSVDILVNNAAVFNTFDLLATEPEEFDRVFGINVKGTFLLCKYVLPYMLDAGRGSIVNVSSAAGVAGGLGGFAYTCSKHALVGMSKQLMSEYGLRGIRANTVCPGAIHTNMVAAAFADESFVKKMSRIPAGRPGVPKDIASVIVFLASDDAAFIHGECILADGGLLRQYATQFNADS